MGEFADFANGGGWGGEGLFEEEYQQPKMPERGTYPTKRRPAVDPRAGFTEAEIRADFLENGFQ